MQGLTCELSANGFPLRPFYPGIRVLENDENNYCRALNLGIENTNSDLVIIANNDATVHRDWLQGLLACFHENPKAGAVQSKIFFTGEGNINSVGVEEIQHFHFREIGFDEPDSPRHARYAEGDYLSGGSVMFRRECLQDVGPWDEDYILFMEDVDYSERCRKKGWKLGYAPGSVMYHRYHGSCSAVLCEYFCNRNRFFFVARHFPLELAAIIPSSQLFLKGEYDSLYQALLHSVQKMVAWRDGNTIRTVLNSLKDALVEHLGEVSTRNFFPSWNCYWACGKSGWESTIMPGILRVVVSATSLKWQPSCRIVTTRLSCSARMCN